MKLYEDLTFAIEHLKSRVCPYCDMPLENAKASHTQGIYTLQCSHCKTDIDIVSRKNRIAQIKLAPFIIAGLIGVLSILIYLSG